MKKNKGFTLVELLAVIVILAIIMIIAIPAVLQTMNSARQKTFREYVTKVFNAANSSYLTSVSGFTGEGGAGQTVSINLKNTGADTTETRACKAFNVQTDLGLSSTGEYKGTVAVCPNSSGKIDILIALNDAAYRTPGVINYTDKGETFDIKASETGTDYSLSKIGKTDGSSPLLTYNSEGYFTLKADANADTRWKN